METRNDEEGGWSSSLSTGHSRLHHEWSAAASGGKSEVMEKTKASDIQMQQLIKYTVHCLPQETSTVLHGWSSLMPIQPKFNIADMQQTTQQIQPKLPPLKGNDHRSPALRWSLLIFNMELRKNGLEVGGLIYGIWQSTVRQHCICWG